MQHVHNSYIGVESLSLLSYFFNKVVCSGGGGCFVLFNRISILLLLPLQLTFVVGTHWLCTLVGHDIF